MNHTTPHTSPRLLRAYARLRITRTIKNIARILTCLFIYSTMMEANTTIYNTASQAVTVVGTNSILTVTTTIPAQSLGYLLAKNPFTSIQFTYADMTTATATLSSYAWMFVLIGNVITASPANLANIQFVPVAGSSVVNT